ncbi:MAG: YlmC/YmxH family sporulation protein [Oscillospiraceae bacterium]|nr:YlmC/YmxH family sporulation protein [Oscillospiraceae bacterium]
MLFSQLCEKEVVSAADGERLGYIDDAEYDEATGEVLRFFIYGRGELFGLLGRSEDVSIERSDIETVGSDILLVRAHTKRSAGAPRRGHTGF